MKIECVKDRFETALQIVERTASKNATLPVLSCVLLDAEAGAVFLRTTNLELGVEVKVPAKVTESGTVAIPANSLLSFVSAVRNERVVTITTTETGATIEVGKSRATFNTLPAGEFPSIPVLHTNTPNTLATEDVAEGIKSVAFAASVNTVKPEYGCVMVVGDQNNLTFAATDSFRLAERQIRLKKGKEFSQILIPQKNANEIARILPLSQTKEVEVEVENQQISFKADWLYVTSRLISGTFPDYHQIIPKEASTEVIVSRQDLVNTMKAATVFSDSFMQVTFIVDPKNKKFEIKTTNPTLGEQVTAIPAAFNGEAVTMNFNYRYVMDCLPSIKTDNLSLSFTGTSRPVIVHGVSERSFTYLVMPMNR